MALRQQTTRDLQSQFETLVDRMFGDFPYFTELPRWGAAGTTAPPMDLYEKDGKYMVELAVPGYEPAEIDVEVTGNMLTVSGRHAETTEKKEAKYHRKEIRRGSFVRTMSLPQDIDSDNVDAKVEKGVLYLELTPHKPIAAKKIAIKGST